MKTLYLYSKRDSVLKHWAGSISRLYEISSFHDIDALYRAVDRGVPTVILFDYDGEIEMADELLALTAEAHPDVKLMFFNGSPLFSHGIHLIRSGASSFMNAYASPNNINQAIRAVLAGNIWLYPEFIQMMIKQNVLMATPQKKLDTLSDREREIAEMVALGMSNREISHTADITEQTVKTHLKTVYEKMGVNSRLELAIQLNSR